ncbi:DNA-binding CsgD family transcriptional regulator [Streptacidiphilus sp. MAP12-16]|uniref:ATP-binding protein n=1 Tax=Streptacidiphilus sp. MAP12-16 TaxID=3156300 RepID=UPI003514D8BE
MDELFGRNDECATLRVLLQHAQRGMSAAVVLRGSAGAGKTALMDYVHRAASPDFEVLRFDAVESEAQLGYAALHQLLLPFLGRIPKLPEPQRDAISQVFGLQRRKTPPDRFLVAMASLGLLASRADGPPLLCLVDDAHWLDDDSAEVLSFIARRMYADSAAIVFAARDGATHAERLTGLPQLPVDSLDPVSAGQLLESVVNGTLAPDVGSRIVASTGGNPLALIEAARELHADQLSGESPLPDPVPLGQKLERSYLSDVAAMPPRTRTLLLAAAADPTGDPNVLWRAGAELGFAADAAEAAEERQLLAIRDTVKFRHPLIRSAIYYGAPLSQRTRVHAALAAVTGDLGNAELRAFHLAAAATEPDEKVAAELEQAAERTRDRGGWTGSSTLLAHAATLTADLPARSRRLLAAAESSAMAGSPGRAQALLDEAAAYRADRRHNGQIQRAQAHVHRLMGEPARATNALLAAARELGPVDIRLARDVLVEALVQAQISDALAPRGATRRSVAEAVRALPLPQHVQATTGDVILEADTALHLEGLAAATPLLKEAIAAASSENSTAAELFPWLAAACSHATILGDDIALHELARRMETEARRQGTVIPMALALSHSALSELIAGHLAEAERFFDQRAALEEARGATIYLGALLVAAWRGEVDTAGQLLKAVDEHAARTGQGYQLVFRDYANAVVELSQSHYQEAYLSLKDRIGEVCQLKFAVVDMVEAAARCGMDDRAAELTERLRRLAERTPVPGLLGDLARARALTCDAPEQAEQLYLEAIEHHRNTRGPGRRARSHQLYGEWLRRERRTKEARSQLRTAHQLFEEMGAYGYAARTARELSAAGDPVEPRDTAGTGDQLTAQEARVAHLAAAGATNAEIAAQLFLSAHTVDYHLRKVFRKLDVHSRRELANQRMFTTPQ